MYNILPDLLKAYYVPISVVLVVGGIIGFGICYSWLRDRKPDAPTTSGAGYDAYGYEEDEQITEPDVPMCNGLYQAKR